MTALLEYIKILSNYGFFQNPGQIIKTLEHFVSMGPGIPGPEDTKIMSLDSTNLTKAKITFSSILCIHDGFLNANCLLEESLPQFENLIRHINNRIIDLKNPDTNRSFNFSWSSYTSVYRIVLIGEYEKDVTDPAITCVQLQCVIDTIQSIIQSIVEIKSCLNQIFQQKLFESITDFVQFVVDNQIGPSCDPELVGEALNNFISQRKVFLRKSIQSVFNEIKTEWPFLCTKNDFLCENCPCYLKHLYIIPVPKQFNRYAHPSSYTNVTEIYSDLLYEDPDDTVQVLDDRLDLMMNCLEWMNMNIWEKADLLALRLQQGTEYVGFKQPIV